MIWNSDCQRVRRQLPLLAGADLLPSEQTDVERHLRQCPACQEELARSESAHSVLQEVRSATCGCGESLWPCLERRLGTLVARSDSRAGWIPVGALAAACAALLLIGLFGPSFDQSVERGMAEGEDIQFRPQGRFVGQAPGRFSPSVPSPHFSDTTSY